MSNLETQKNSRQIPKTKEICANKKYYDILYAYLQCISEPYDKDDRYVLAKDVKFVKLAEVLNITRQTVSNKFKNLIELGLIEKKDDIYLIKYLNKNSAMIINYQVLKLIIDTLSENAINTYVWLFNEYCKKQYKSFKFTLEQVKQGIGICSTTRSNDDVITNILFVLKKIGLIDYQLTAEKQDSSSFENIKTIYQLNWLKNSVHM